MNNRIQECLVDEIRRQLDAELFKLKLDMISRINVYGESDYDQGFLDALDKMEEKVENIIRYFETVEV